MRQSELQPLINQGESETLEFKSSTAQLRAAFETVCAFLNGKGGTVLIGVTADGKMTGQDVTDNTRQEIANHLLKLEPSAQARLNIEHIAINDTKKHVILFKILPGDHLPYTYDGRAFVRYESTTSRMSQHCYEQLLIKRGYLNHAWEEFIADGYSLEDLDHEEIYKTVSDGIKEGRIPASAQRENVSEILDRLNLMVEGKLKRAAVVLYAKQESLRLMQCMIKMARFKGLDKLGEFIDNQQIHGNAFRLLSEADAFFRRHLPIASSFKSDQFKRIDTPALPVMAVREALVNAFCHRDYSDVATDLSIAIFDDRVELWNSGELPQKITIEDLKHTHKSVQRNKLIANAFYVRGLIEKWGTGTNRMINLCRQDNIPDPEFVESCGGLEVVFKFKEPLGGAVVQHKEIEKSDLMQRQKEVLQVLNERGALGVSEIMKYLSGSINIRTLQRDLTFLKKREFIDSKGHGRNVLWKLITTNHDKSRQSE